MRWSRQSDGRHDLQFIEDRRRSGPERASPSKLAAADGAQTPIAPLDIGIGVHTAKLLELAQRPNATRETIIADWNEWVAVCRKDNRSFRLDLREFNANAGIWKETPLWGKPWDEYSTPGLNLSNIDFRGAKLVGSRFECAILQGVRLDGANLAQCVFDSALMWGANLQNARVFRSWFDNAYLWDCNVTGSAMNWTSFQRADVSGIQYRHYSGLWPFRRNLMLGKYIGVNGVDSCYGDAGFRRDALDQDFIDEKMYDCLLMQESGWSENYRKFRISQNIWIGWIVNPIPVFVRAVRWKELHRRLIPRILFYLWGVTNYGRSVASVGLLAAVFIVLFGAIYATYLLPHGDILITGELARLPAIPHKEWYAAAMGAATLGLTDLLHPASILGEAVMFLNVVTGFFLFGMMVAVLQNKFARRA